MTGLIINKYLPAKFPTISSRVFRFFFLSKREVISMNVNETKNKEEWMRQEKKDRDNNTRILVNGH